MGVLYQEEHRILRGDARAALGAVRIGLIVREATKAPAIATLDSFKMAMLDAQSIVHSNPAATPRITGPRPARGRREPRDRFPLGLGIRIR